MRTERDRELGERKEGFVVLLGEKKERWSLGTSEFEDANVDHLLIDAFTLLCVD